VHKLSSCMIFCVGLFDFEHILCVGLVRVEHVWCCAQDYLVLNIYYV
jgi:hypothetical protein